MTHIKRKSKDSVFTALFSQKEYAYQLYKSLHPEDNTTREEDIRIISIENVLVNDLYNDIGLMVAGRLIILAEAQSTWNPNIPMRMFLYLAETYKRYISDNDIDILSSGRIEFPRPELYVIYTGSRRDEPEELRFSDMVTGGEGKPALELNVRMLYTGSGNDIVYQYVAFCKVFDAQRRAYPEDPKKAVLETVRICRDKKVLERFLRQHETEVRNLMSDYLFNEERLREIHYRNLNRQEIAKAHQQGIQMGIQQGLQRGMEQGAQRMQEVAKNALQMGLAVEQIAKMTGLSEDAVKILAEKK